VVKIFNLTNITLAVVLLSTSVLAQPFVPPLYSLEGGSRVYFVPSHSLTYKGQEYSEEYTLEFDLFASILTPKANFTLSHFPTKYLQNEVSSLSISKHRLDIEWKYLPIQIHPITTLELVDLEFYSVTDLFQSKIESEMNLYGGLGGSLTSKLTDHLDIKGVAIYRFINQSGWESGLSFLYKTPRIFTVDSHLVGGIQIKDLRFDWGRSKGYGLMLELGLTF
jgi:hypothetical protein